MKTLSIVIPHFNSSSTVVSNLKQILDSCFLFLLEGIYIVDDFSSTESYTEIKNFICNDDLKNITSLFRLRKNSGANFCRRLGLRKARGDYVVFLDADDSISEKYLESLHNVIMSNDYPAFIFANVVYVKDSKRDLSMAPLLAEARSGKNYGSDLLFSHNFMGVGIQTSAWIIKRSLIKGRFWKLGLEGHQDWFFLMAFFADNETIKPFYDNHIIICRNKFSNGGHVSDRLDFNFSLEFLKKNLNLFSLSARVYYTFSVLAVKGYKKSNGIVKLFWLLVFSINIHRLSFWRYMLKRYF